MKEKESNKTITLFKWIWHSYLKTAIIPLVLVEFVFIGIYFVTNNWSQKETVSFLRQEVQFELSQFAEQEGKVIQQQLNSINNSTELYRQQMARVLATPAELKPEDAERLKYSPEGVYYTSHDKKEGGAAVFYSGILPIGEAERKKAARALTAEKLMIDIKTSQPLAASLYLNTFDSLNVIYPYFDVISQYPPLMDIPSYNFYYEADAAHNPNREVRWTDAYLDPAGHGWMASAIAPVYNGDLLEGVVGIDVTISTITEHILNMNVPWQGYGILVGKDGKILALPEKGEGEWGLTELTKHHYSEAIKKDTFKPEEFNIYKRNNLSELAENVYIQKNGFTDALIGEESKVVSWATVPQTGWKLLVIVDNDDIYANVNAMRSKLYNIGTFMIAGLILFYCIFFLILFRKSYSMSRRISEPLMVINKIVRNIGKGEYYQQNPDLYVQELQDTALNLVKTGESLGMANQDLIETQEELRKREADLQALVNSIDDVIIEVDDNGNCVNSWFQDEELLPLSFMGKSIASLDEIIDGSMYQVFMSIIKRVIETEKTEKVEYVTQTHKGLRTFQVSISLITKESRLVAICARDITERIEMERKIIASKEEAEKASKAKSEFLSSMSHELRTPLNSILGFAQLLKIDIANPMTDSQGENVEEIIKAGKHLLVLINEILDLAKIESGKILVSLEIVNIQENIEEVISLVRLLAERQNVKILPVSFTCTNKYVKADHTRLKQVILNIMTNAIKYNKEGGYVEIHCESLDESVRINISDTGRGIPDNEIEAIFEPFYRLHASDSYHEGTGIGLTVAKQLVELMGGSIGVESKLGEGSNFWFDLPRANENEYFADMKYEKPEERTNIEIKDAGPKDLQGEHKILYVEDNPANLDLAKRIFMDSPLIKLSYAKDGISGIELALKERFELIILDINLPDIDGYEVLKRLKKHAETKDIPVMALTANAMPQDISKGKAAGFVEYITKPIDIEKFKCIVNKYLIKS